jgi:hypothetical protein
MQGLMASNYMVAMGIKPIAERERRKIFFYT